MMKTTAVCVRLVLALGVLFVFGCAVPGTGGAGTGGGSALPVGPENPSGEQVVRLSRAMTNKLLYGKAILDATLAKYGAVLDFYGAEDAADIRSLINAGLSPAGATALEMDNAFNYNGFKEFQDVPLYYVEGDGQYTPLTAVPITPTGDFNSQELKDKIRGKLVALEAKLKDKSGAFDPNKEFDDFHKEIKGYLGAVSQKNLKQVQKKLKGFCEFIGSKLTDTQVSSLSKFCKGVSEVAGWVGGVFSAVGFVMDLFMPSQEEQMVDVMNENFQIVFEYLDGIVDYLDVLNDKIDELHSLLLEHDFVDSNQSLNEVRITMSNALTQLRNPGYDEEDLAELAFRFTAEIDALIGKFILYMNDAYDFYKRMVMDADEKSDLHPSTLIVTLPIDETIRSVDKKNRDAGTEVLHKPFEIRISIPNPQRFAPYDANMLQYLHHTLMARMRMNVFWQKDTVRLDQCNQFIAEGMLKNNDYLGGVKKAITAAYAQAQAEYAVLMAEIDSQSAAFQAYLGAIGGDWNFSAVKQPHNGGFSYFYTGLSAKDYGGVSFQTTDGNSIPLASASSGSAAVAANPYAFINNADICYNAPPFGGYSSPDYTLREQFPWYYCYSSEYYYNQSQYCYVITYVTPKKFPVSISHTPLQATLKLVGPDGNEIIELSPKHIGEYDVISSLKDFVGVLYKAKAESLLQLFVQYTIMEADMQFYINDPENSSF